MTKKFFWCWPATVFLLIASAEARPNEDYSEHVRPLLRAKCWSCHGAVRAESGLRLDTGPLILQGGESGAAAQPGNPDQSLLIQRVTAEDESRMPPPGDGTRLSAEEVRVLREWIGSGAEAPPEEPPAGPRDHWAFRPVESPASAGSGDGNGNPIDRYFSRRHQQLQLTPQPQAPRGILLRRLYLDVIGLPPTAEQLNDDRDLSVIIDELLASPHHGERWGRHWLDVWRYTDWYGLGAQLRRSQRHIWRWRDWVVASLNADKPYSRMITEMLAGDEADPLSEEAVTGTGFLARNYYLFNRTTWLDDTIEHTGKAFLGLTLNCAKCHDHKYDPISHEDYYRMRAVFEPHHVRLDPVSGSIDPVKSGLPRVYDDQPEAVTYLHMRGDPAQPDKSRPITPGIPSLFAEQQPPVHPVSLPSAAWAVTTRDSVQEDLFADADRKIAEAQRNLMQAEQRLQQFRAAPESDSASDAFHFADDFSTQRDADWQIVGDCWEYRDGSLVLTRAGRDHAWLRLKRQLPRDFNLRCVLTTTGGTTYRSVTFSFDAAADRGTSNYVYTSAHAPGPKVQVAWKRAGKSTYPAEGRASHPIETGRKYELEVRVRDRLVNVLLDGSLLVVTTFPDRSPQNFLELSGFDATAAFHEIEVSAASGMDDMTMQDVYTPGTEAGLVSAVSSATSRHRAAQLRAGAVRAVIQADAVRYGGTPDESDRPEIATPEEIRVKASAAIAAADLAEAEADLAVAKDDKERNSARQRIKDAKARVADPSPDYPPLRVVAKALESPAHKAEDDPAVYSPVSSGRRLALAAWITSPDNPLTARVAVNHVWARHFGKPLVSSMTDFGLRTPKPRHAELLDLLASEFMDSGWSFRHLHRLILNSAAWQRSSSDKTADPRSVAHDPENDEYRRAEVRRMEAEVVRDSLLLLGGQLDRTLGGPPIAPKTATGRRTLYFRQSRDDVNRFAGTFDAPDHLACYRRRESIVPQQALAMINSSDAFEAATAVAARLSSLTDSTAGDSGDQAEPGDQVSDEDFTERAFQQILARQPTPAEVGMCCDYLSSIPESEVGSDDVGSILRRRSCMILALLNHNDFISIR